MNYLQNNNNNSPALSSSIALNIVYYKHCLIFKILCIQLHLTCIQGIFDFFKG